MSKGGDTGVCFVGEGALVLDFLTGPMPPAGSGSVTLLSVWLALSSRAGPLLLVGDESAN